MARDLKADQALLREVLAHTERRDFARAAALADQALASGFDHPLLLNVLATRREQEGRLEEALALLERAVSIAPGDVGARNALALCLQRLDRPMEALGHVEELLRQHPDLGFAHANRGNALIALGQLGQAKQSHLKALELEPGSIAAAAALASIATHRGEHAEARGYAEKALSLMPGLPDAVLTLAAAELAGGATARAETLLWQLLADPRAGAMDKARASGLLGDVLDAAGRYPEAFDAYTTCNDQLKQIYRRHADARVLDYARSLTQAMRAAGPGPWAPAPATAAAVGGAAGHVFMVGFPRSGTTLTEVVLDGHPGIVSIEEHELLIDAVLKFMGEPLDLGALIRADESELEALRAAYWQRARGAGFDVAGKVFIDKYPLNTLKLPLIARLFPRAKILFARRDPRDVVLGCFRRRFKMNPAMYQLLTLGGAAAFYDAVMEFAELAKPVLGLNWRVVSYESLVADLSGETDAICEFLGIEPVVGMADFAQRVREREHSTPSTAQLARGLDRSGIGHWRHYAANLAPVLPTLEPWARRFGYPA